jgi:hypothetical protein
MACRRAALPSTQCANVGRRGATAATDQPRAEAVPFARVLGERCCDRSAVPAHSRGVVAFTRVRIDDDGLGGVRRGDLDQRCDVLRRSAVDPDRGDLRAAFERIDASGERLALADMHAVAAREADPRLYLGKLRQQTRQRDGLVAARQCFAGEQIGAGRCEHCETRAMERDQRVDVQAIVAVVFGAVVQRRTIRADRRGDKRIGAARACPRVGPEHLARFARERHRAAQEACRRCRVEPAACKAFEARLIAGSRCDIGTSHVVVEMHLADQFGRVQQHLGRPQWVVQVGAAALELGREPAVEDHDPMSFEQFV